jgi:cystathionine beta-lyase
LDDLHQDLAQNRSLLRALLDEHLPEVRWAGSPGSYLAWLDCRDLRLEEDPATVFLERGGVAVSSGLTFGTGGAGHVRLNFATTPEILTIAIHRIARAIRRVK